MGTFSRLGNDLYSGARAFDFVGRRWLWYGASGLIVLIAVAGLSIRGVNLGIEFTGGAQYTVSVPGTPATQAEADALRQTVASSGIPGTESPQASTAGPEGVLVQTKVLSSADGDRVAQVILDATGASAADLSQTEIGPSWGRDIAQRALLGLGVFLVLVSLMIWAYFREWKMSVAALVALAHDLVITIGVYALVGFEVTPATVTGLLTILGFSLYDTVVVFDKVRENTRSLRESRTTYAAAANRAVNQTVVRSINTSIVALLPVGAILYVGAAQLGSGALKDLALALFVGMAAGAYSSIFIATPLLVQLKSRESAVVLADKRAKARERNAADPYAAVPSFSEDMPLADEPGSAAGRASGSVEEPVPSGVAEASSTRTEAMGRGRTSPTTRAPVRPSSAAGRQQPVRETRSKRQK